MYQPVVSDNSTKGPCNGYKEKRGNYESGLPLSSHSHSCSHLSITWAPEVYGVHIVWEEE